ncbi:MAG: hypothetical protein HY231_01645 [Acidobacteria bacterium]|nr:hypothetical protein [Acidobacteriota bacterium]
MKRKVVVLSMLFALASVPAAMAKDHKEFAALSARLSEQAGFFDSDNLISNETSYLHVFGKLTEFKIHGGVYLGVGPDQNFTYIAKIRPSRAIIIDIRRDNLLQHLLYKALFERAKNRIEYLCLLFGKPLPKDKGWESKDIKALVDYIDTTKSEPKLFTRTIDEMKKDIAKFGIALSEADLKVIANIQNAFYEAGLDVRYSSHNRPPRSIYPSMRDLLLERDLAGEQHNYFAAEDDWQFIKKLEDQDLIIPVVGDLAGTAAMKNIGKYLNEIKERVTAFYCSNVEFYVHRQNQYDRFVENLAALPIDKNSLIIRSYFNYYAPLHPQTEKGHYSTQLLQRIEDLLAMCKAGDCESYEMVVTKNSIPLH